MANYLIMHEIQIEAKKDKNANIMKSVQLNNNKNSKQEILHSLVFTAHSTWNANKNLPLIVLKQEQISIVT